MSPLARSVRMDVIAMDEEHTVYNTEMQDERKTDLAKRSRYYQALADTNLLEPGIPNYNLLNETYIILIMTFDLFGYKKYQYTFESRCKEVPDLVLGDKTTDEVAESVESVRIKRIHTRVRKVKTSEEVGIKYMQAWEEKYFEREEGREEGERLKLISQIQKKILRGKSLEETADALEEETDSIRELYNLITHNQGKTEQEIFDLWNRQ